MLADEVIRTRILHQELRLFGTSKSDGRDLKMNVSKANKQIALETLIHERINKLKRDIASSVRHSKTPALIFLSKANVAD